MPGTNNTSVDNQLQALLDIHGYVQLVNMATRGIKLLDVVITRQSDKSPVVTNVNIFNSYGLSDHAVLVCELTTKRYKPAPVHYTYRDIKNIDVTESQERLYSSHLFTVAIDVTIDITPDDYVDLLTTTVTNLLDEVAPLRTGNRAGGRYGARWLSPEAVTAKRRRRKLERRWKATGEESDRGAYRAACHTANSLINQSRNQFRCRRIIQAKDNPRRLWNSVKTLLHSNDTYLDPAVQPKDFCSVLASFFINKVNDIKVSISSVLGATVKNPFTHDCEYEGLPFCAFSPVTAGEVERLLTRMSAKSSPLDFIPTSLLKSCKCVFATIIARLANISFDHSHFPTRFKSGIITPLIKDHSSDVNAPSNYRPITNLNRISKILERLALSRLIPHVNSSSGFDPMQSAYRRFYSTETALLKVTSDIFQAFDHHQTVVLVALDQSAAFDCVDHNTLLKRLHHTFGITDDALEWLQSYLFSRQSFVRYGQYDSSVSTIEVGVPQGSSLGPLLFSLYISPLAAVIRQFGVQYHQYADDTQVYIATDKTITSSQVTVLEHCLQAVHTWLLHNSLCLNPVKSDAIVFVPSRQQNAVPKIDTVSVCGSEIVPSATVKSLGVILDSALSMDKQVATSICKTCYFHIRAFHHVRPSLPDDVARTVACSIVQSRLDYCNSLLLACR